MNKLDDDGTEDLEFEELTLDEDDPVPEPIPDFLPGENSPPDAEAPRGSRDEEILPSQEQALLSLTDETITQEQINDMKMLGVEKPDQISWDRWNRLQSARLEHKHMIHLAASGVPQWRIAQTLGYDQPHVSKVLNTPEIRQAVAEEIRALYGDDHKKMMKDRVVKAVGVVDEVLETAPLKEKAPMARWVIEHSIGKASQDIQVTKTTLSEVLVKIEEMKSNKLRDVSVGAQDLPKEKDHFDTVIEQVIPQGMIIGKRTGGTSGEGQGE